MSAESVFGRHLKRWRKQRGVSQLDLSARTGVSQRHISFIETGRSRPKAEVINRVAEALQIPLRERNRLLEAAGLPSRYAEAGYDDQALHPFRSAISRMLTAQEPYPAYVINRYWEIVDLNEAGRRMFPQHEATPGNVLTSFFGRGPIRDMIENFDEVASGTLHRLRNEVAEAGQDPRLEQLLELAEELLSDVPLKEPKPGSDLVVCPRLRIGDQVVRTVSVVARFGNAREVTVDELRVELVFPFDDAADAFFRAAAGL